MWPAKRAALLPSWPAASRRPAPPRRPAQEPADGAPLVAAALFQEDGPGACTVTLRVSYLLPREWAACAVRIGRCHAVPLACGCSGPDGAPTAPRPPARAPPLQRCCSSLRAPWRCTGTSTASCGAAWRAWRRRWRPPTAPRCWRRGRSSWRPCARVRALPGPGALGLGHGLAGPACRAAQLEAGACLAVPRASVGGQRQGRGHPWCGASLRLTACCRTAPPPLPLRRLARAPAAAGGGEPPVRGREGAAAGAGAGAAGAAGGGRGGGGGSPGGRGHPC